MLRAGEPTTDAVNPRVGSEGLVVRAWRTESGLPQNTVNAIVQTRDGYLWVGTREGLARFDGVRFTVFGLNEGLPSVEVMALCEGHDGTLWIGTSGGGLSRLVGGRIEIIGESARSFGSGVITALTEDGEGCLWIGTLAGLTFWRDGHFVTKPELAILERAGVRSLLRDRHGGMWIDTSTGGLFEYRNNQLNPELGPAGNERIVAYCLLEDKEGNLWASVGNGTVLCRRGRRWGKYDQADGLPFAYVTSLAEEVDGSIWAGSLDDGLYYLKDGRFYRVRKGDGISADDIRSLLPDREGNLWVGTRTGGLNRLSRRNLLPCGAAQGLTNDFTRSVAETADGTLWVGTTGGGLYRGNLEALHPFTPEPIMAFYAGVDAVLAAPDGSLWWGGSHALLRWREGKLAACYTNETWLGSAGITALSEDRKGGLWIGTSAGRLVHFQSGEFREFPRRIARGAVTALAPQADSSLWVGSVAGGLRRVRSGSEEVFSVTNGLLSKNIRTLYLGKDETLWIGTAGGGLSRWRDGRITNVTTRQGLGANTISQIVEDDYGHLWLGSSHGIFRVALAALNDLADGKTSSVHPTAFGLNDGLPAEECSSGFCPAGLKTRAGLICFSTVKGLVFVDPRRQGPNRPPPPAQLEDIIVNGQPRQPVQDFPAEGDEPPASLLTDPPAYQHLVLPPGARELELHYTAINLRAPEAIRFRYRLDGLASEWTEAVERRTAYYHQVPPGDYVFEVAACNAEGIWSETPSLLALTIQPYIWETRWFRLAAGAVFFVAVVGTLRWAEQRKFKRRLARLQMQHAVEKERLRISQDMHDHIGGMLTQVSQLSDLGHSEAAAPAVRGRFERIGAQARAAVQALDEIIWATNPKNDNLPRFGEYVSRFADEFFEGSAIRCWQEVPTDLPNLPLPADVRHNVFLAVREAVHNVLKHSGASAVWLRLTLDKAEIRLEIEDNGQGFAVEKIAAGRNGLLNMKTRLAECAGRAEVISVVGKGTTVRYIFPVSAGTQPPTGLT